MVSVRDALQRWSKGYSALVALLRAVLSPCAALPVAGLVDFPVAGFNKNNDALWADFCWAQCVTLFLVFDLAQ